MPAAWGMWVAMGDDPVMTRRLVEPPGEKDRAPQGHDVLPRQPQGGVPVLEVQSGQVRPLGRGVGHSILRYQRLGGRMRLRRPTASIRASAWRSAAAALVMPSARARAKTAMVAS